MATAWCKGAVCVLSVGVLAGCVQSKPVPVVPAPVVSEPERARVDAFVSGHGVGADEFDAYARATESLGTALLGDARWLSIIPVAVHERARDPYVSVRIDQGWEVAIGLDKGRAATVLDEMTYAEPSFDGPPAWHDALFQVLSVHVAKLVCERRASLYGLVCDPPETAEDDARLDRLRTGLVLTSAMQGGVPADADGFVLRPGRVRASLRDTPVAGLPVVIAGPDGEEHRGQTDAHGVVELPVPVGAQWPGIFEVRVDAERMAGPLVSAPSWPGVSVDARAPDFARWALVFEEGTSPDGAFAEALLQTLEGSLGSPVNIEPEVARALGRVGPAERARVLVALADSMAGRLDVVVLVRAQSRFASRAGASRVWFEASSRVVVHEVWGAGELGRDTAEATESGVGDQRADEAARRAVARSTGDRVLSILRPR